MSNISSISTDDRINQESVDEINYEFKYGEFIKFAILSPICIIIYISFNIILYSIIITLWSPFICLFIVWSPFWFTIRNLMYLF